METIETYKTYKKTIRHKFYCDECNDFIGSSAEYDDGYYDKIGEVVEKVYIYNDWYYLKRTLCDNCKDKFYEKLMKKLKDIGFVREKH